MFFSHLVEKQCKLRIITKSNYCPSWAQQLLESDTEWIRKEKKKKGMDKWWRVNFYSSCFTPKFGEREEKNSHKKIRNHKNELLGFKNIQKKGTKKSKRVFFIWKRELSVVFVLFFLLFCFCFLFCFVFYFNLFVSFFFSCDFSWKKFLAPTHPRKKKQKRNHVKREERLFWKDFEWGSSEKTSDVISNERNLSPQNLEFFGIKEESSWFFFSFFFFFLSFSLFSFSLFSLFFLSFLSFLSLSLSAFSLCEIQSKIREEKQA